MIVWYVLAALAVWRLSVFLVEEDGPWGSAAWLRWYAGIETHLDGTVIARGFFAELLMCTRCVSFWLGLVATAVLWPGEDWRGWVLTPLALSGAAVLIEVMRRR